jgi:4-amino-4-deoxy-L-arabinose transferase-like glycosyltransferase
MNIENKDDRHHRIALILSLTILLICLTINYFRQVGTFGVETDFYGVYAIQAENILEGKPYTYQHNPPGYCLLLAIFTYFIGDTFAAGKLISALATGIFTYISYLLLSILTEKKIALVITFFSLLAIIPYSFIASTDVLGATLIIASIWFYLRRQTSVISKTTNYFFSGLIAGCAYITRANGIFLAIGILTSILIFNPHRETIKKRLITTAIFIAGLMSIVLPWLVYNWQTNGSAFASTAHAQIAAHFYHPQGDKLITSVNEMGDKFKSLTEVILYDPIDLITIYSKDILFANIPAILVPKFLLSDAEFPVYQILITPPLILFISGIYCLLRDIRAGNKEKQSKVFTFLLINLLGYLILGLVGFSRRYYFFFLPCLFLILVYSIYRSPFWLKSSRHDLLLKITSIIFAILLTIPLPIVASIETYDLIASEPKYLLEIAAFLQSKTSPHQTIVVRKPHLAYLAKLNPVFPLANTATEYLAVARTNNAKYIVYSDYEATLWEGLKSLANPQQLPQEFRLIYRHIPSNTLIYQIPLNPPSKGGL